MCGIVGFIRKKNDRPSDDAMLEQMVGLIRHRGPDDMGTAHLSFESNAHGSVYLGFVRLSIRDLTANGHQPMFSDDGRVITFEVWAMLYLDDNGHGIRSRLSHRQSTSYYAEGCKPCV